MAEAQIRVIAYAGYRAEESPRAFFFNGARIDVMKVLDQWLEEQEPAAERRRYFRVKGSDFRAHLLCYHEQRMTWFYCN